MHTFNITHARHAAHRGDNPLELFLIPDFHGHLDNSRVQQLFVGTSLDATDVDLLAKQDLGQLVQQASAVVAVDNQTNVKLLAGTLSPFHLDAALGLVHQVLHVRARSRVHCDAFAAGNVADDRFAPDRVTATGAIG